MENFYIRRQNQNSRFYFVIRWENNVGEKGPWSEILSAIVP
jgi:hypothetical protein